MTRRRGLGKGLDALIPSDEMERKAGVQEVPIDGIHPNPRQPRTQIDPEALRELAESIREHGILQPLIVSPEPFGAGDPHPHHASPAAPPDGRPPGGDGGPDQRGPRPRPALPPPRPGAVGRAPDPS